jgi:hypothetical protein
VRHLRCEDKRTAAAAYLSDLEHRFSGGSMDVVINSKFVKSFLFGSLSRTIYRVHALASTDSHCL